MADDTETTTEEQVPETEQAPEERRHPLEPGGVRFEDVVREKNELKATAAELRARIAALEARTPEPAKPVQTPTLYTADQLQQAVDQGRITAAQMADQLAWQRAQEVRQQVVAETSLQQKRASATAEVTQYMDRIPALGDRGSKEWLRAAQAARDLSDDMGLPIEDPRVQRAALRQSFGSLDRIADAGRTREYAREHADTSIETRGGGSRAQSGPTDPFKDVPRPLMDEWKRLGYSTEQMKEELKYVDLARWKRKYG